MISNLITTSITAAMFVCVIVPVGCLAYCLTKRKGRRENLFFNTAIGLAALMVASNLSRLVMAIPPLPSLMDSGIPQFMIFMLVTAVSVGVFELLARYFTVSYTAKISGMSFYRAAVIGIGVGAGQVLLNASTYSQYLNQAKMINNGTFINTVVEQKVLDKAGAEAYQELFAAINPFDYFVKAIDHGALVFLEIALTIVFVYLIIQNKKKAALLITFGARAAFELLRMTFSFAASDYLGKVLSVTVSNIIYAVIMLIFLAGSIYVIYIMSKKFTEDIPATRNRPGQPAGYNKAKAEEEDRQQRKAWQEIRQMQMSGRSNKAEEKDGEEEAESSEAALEDKTEGSSKNE